MDPEETQRATDMRSILRLGGEDVREFLQGLVTNDLAGLDTGAVYAALLTPQGKYLSDFFLVADGDDILMDLPADQVPAVAQRLAMYKLRAKVTIAPDDWRVARGLDAPPPGAVADPRHPEMGWRLYGPDVTEAPDISAALEHKRIALGIPRAGIELTPGEGYILETGFDRLHGVDFRKGCYVGQEVVARMKHKTQLRKGLVRVRVSGTAPIGTEITRDGRPVGTLYSQADGIGLAFLRFDRAGPGMTAAGTPVDLFEAP